MTLEESEDQNNNLGVSLTRLRLFLSPHAQGSKEEAHIGESASHSSQKRALCDNSEVDDAPETSTVPVTGGGEESTL